MKEVDCCDYCVPKPAMGQACTAYAVMLLSSGPSSPLGPAATAAALQRYAAVQAIKPQQRGPTWAALVAASSGIGLSVAASSSSSSQGMRRRMLLTARRAQVVNLSQALRRKTKEKMEKQMKEASPKNFELNDFDDRDGFYEDDQEENDSEEEDSEGQGDEITAKKLNGSFRYERIRNSYKLKQIWVPPVVTTQVEETPEFIDPEEVIFGQRLPFAELGIKDPRLLEALAKLGFMDSTRVQAACIPQILDKDRRAVVVSAETGSGKTLAYLAPAFELILQMGPRPRDCPHPAVMIMVPGLELGIQVSMVASQLAKAIKGSREISVFNARRSWPNKVPDVLVCTPRAAAEGLQPCQSEDEIARRVALERIRGTEMVVFDEADLLFDAGSHASDVRSVLTAIFASVPSASRQVLPEAQVYYEGGMDAQLLDMRELTWQPVKAFSNADGTFNCRLLEQRRWKKWVKRRYLRGPGIGLLVENGPRCVAICATLPSYTKSCYTKGKNAYVPNYDLLLEGKGSPDYLLKRWFPNAVRIQSEWVHRRHPSIIAQEWIYIDGETKEPFKLNLQERINTTLKLLKEQGPDVRTLLFAGNPDSCIKIEKALQDEHMECVALHAGVPFTERIEGLKKFGMGQVSLLVCTDIAARGLDLPICEHVIQVEFAKNSVAHLHRIGRAARAAKKAKSTALWGRTDVSLRNTIMQADQMGLTGEVLTRTGNRPRMRRTRKKQRQQLEMHDDIRARARMARYRTQ
eukprot:TRINITY_DN5009_c0_g1_i2.p1 TRINITY_DN5009_c0_g1~~TRINITY_DN5009_c0_g1_i2.p1  ORF type:complete len:747 (+),score=146.20 TRINITY_DN5009_c0_g1_i2:37-2277(+)